MPTFVPLRRPLQLPTVGDAIERPVFDCKEEPAKSQFEMAKDVAAFANHLGGMLLLGAVESGEVLRRYAGMTTTDAGKAIKDYSAAVADRCWPRPVLDPECYDDRNDTTKRRIVAINIQPSLDLVSVKVKADKGKEDWGGDADVFPVRSGNNARYLEPGQLAMFMTPHVRRVAVLLSRAKKGDLVLVKEPSGYDFSNRYTRVDEIREEENIVTFSGLIPGEPTPSRIPLDRITTVFETWDPSKSTNVWTIHVELWNHPPPPSPPIGGSR